MNEKQLTALFKKLGARDPEGWARSQAQEGINQLGRFLFLRQAWRGVVDETDDSWIERELRSAEVNPDGPYTGVGKALASLKARGATPAELTDLVRGMQAELLFHICYLLGDPGDVEPEVKEVSWSLAQLDAEGNVVDWIEALHESVLETDPTGREMCPRTRDSSGQSDG